MPHRLRLVLAALCTAALTHGAHAAIIVDAFNGPFTLNLPAGGPDTLSVSGGGPNPGGVDGVRGLVFERLGGAGAQSLLLDAASSGVLRLVVPDGNTAAVRLQWDGDTNPSVLDANGLGGLDLTEGGLNTHFIFGQRASSGLAALTLTVYTATGVASMLLDTVATDAADPFLAVEVPFTAFVGTADFTQVGAIELSVDSGKAPGLMLEIDGLLVRGGTVPEPGTLALVGLALAGLFLHRRRS